MTKHRFDTRTWVEIVGDLVISHTSQGDSVKLLVKFNGSNKPSVWLDFVTFDPDKKSKPSREEITDWIDDTPYYQVIDDSSGKPIPGEMQKGNSNWREYVDVRFGPLVQSIIKSGGRQFSYEEIK
jgi:hypothetical protein